MLAFLAFGTVGAVLKVYYDYQRGMAEAAEHVAAVREERHGSERRQPNSAPARSATSPVKSTRCRSRDPSRERPGQPPRHAHGRSVARR
jgi:hypothetical protein